MGKYFGTDGIRGIAGEFPVVQPFIEKLGYVSAKIIFSRRPSDKKPIVFIGRDTRASGADIVKWLKRGLSAFSCDVFDVGIAPTPCIAYLAQKYKARFAVVVSASHNPAKFNGIKFFDGHCRKIADEIELEIEKEADKQTLIPAPRADFVDADGSSLVSDYISLVLESVHGLTLSGKKIVLDCANGANFKIGKDVFQSLGTQTAELGCLPDGHNINEGRGATDTAVMQKMVLSENAFCGISFDGDGDRVIFSDEKGRIFDGDDIIAFLSAELKKNGKLKNDKVALTVMSNFGLVNFLKDNGISAVETAVGDKNVFSAIERDDLSIGGETSGHIILRDFLPTGDGLLTAVQVLKLLAQAGKPLSYFKDLWTKYPSVLKAVPVKEKIPLEKLTGFLEKVNELEVKLGPRSRVFVRYSGTEPKLRILVEGPDAEKVKATADEIEKIYGGCICQ